MLFLCSHCDHTAKVKKNAIWHFIRMHIPVEQVPFSCSLCGYRAKKLQQLQNHVKGYSTHYMRKLTCPDMRDEAFFMQSKNPYRVNIGQDIVMQIEEKQSVVEVEKNEETVQEEKREEEKDVRDEECVQKKDLLQKALDICDINEESMFVPDYQEEEELEAEKVVVVQRTEGSMQTEEVETKEESMQTDVMWEEWERKKKMENKAFGEYIGRLEKRLKEKDIEIERLREELRREKRKRTEEYGVDESYGLDEFEEMWRRRKESPERKKIRSVVCRPDRRRY